MQDLFSTKNEYPMTARPDYLTTTLKFSLASQLLADPDLNKSALAHQFGLSRPTLYALQHSAQHALTSVFSPHSPPPPLHQEGYWLWVDSNLLKRSIALLRATCGATFSAIAAVLLEMFGLRLSHGEICEVVQESYQKAFEYQEKVSLHTVKRAAFDEMYRWRRCELVGVDCDSHFIFLSEKQPGCSAPQWERVMERLKARGLNPEQVAQDGCSSIKKAQQKVWSKARVAHDINHPRRAIDEVRKQFEQKAYKAIEAMDKVRLRVPNRLTTQEHLDGLLAETSQRELLAVHNSEVVSAWVRQAQEAFNVVHSETGIIQEVTESQKEMKIVAAKLRSLGTTASKVAASVLENLGQEIVLERVEYKRTMAALSTQLEVSFEVIEKATQLWQLSKQRAGAPWRGTKELIWKKILKVQSEMERRLGSVEKAVFVSAVVSASFGKILAASSAAEGAIERLSAVMYPQKRPSSGFLQLRAAYLNLLEVEEGLRAGHSSHELMTGEEIPNWLEKLGYKPSENQERSYKKLGWRRLVEPFEKTWKKNYGGERVKTELE